MRTGKSLYTIFYKLSEEIDRIWSNTFSFIDKETEVRHRNRLVKYDKVLPKSIKKANPVRHEKPILCRQITSKRIFTHTRK